jgi:hypothetical protein
VSSTIAAQEKPIRNVLTLVVALASFGMAQTGSSQERTQAERVTELEQVNRDLVERIERLEAGEGGMEDDFDESSPFGLQVQYGEVAAAFQIFGDVGFA